MEMIHVCGHEFTERESLYLGRGKAREKRIAEIASSICPACHIDRIIKESYRFTSANGTHLPEKARLALVERRTKNWNWLLQPASK